MANALLTWQAITISGANALRPASRQDIASQQDYNGSKLEVLPMADPKLSADRPLSPHIQIYRWPITMTMSILHRVTGGALYVGTLLLAWWLLSAATGAQAFAWMQWFMGSPIGLLVLFGYTWALMHHMLGGIRHFIWDLGHGLGPGDRDRLARYNLIGSVVLTILIWIIGIWVLSGN
jgi:succinate dehydrogenase / fumarate reductase cytochrome b subunit